MIRTLLLTAWALLLLLAGPGGAYASAQSPSTLPRPGSSALDTPGAWLAPAGAPDGIPEEVLREMDVGRFWHAERLLERTSELDGAGEPGWILLKARVRAGWRSWRGVTELLDGAPWLDEVGGGVGWALLGRAAEEDGRWVDAADHYRRYLEVVGPGELQGVPVARARRILALARTGEAPGPDVIEELERLKAESAFAASWTALAAARAWSESGSPEGVRAAMAAMADADALERASELVAVAYLAAGDSAAAETAFAAAAELDVDVGARSLLRAGELALARGDTAVARARFLGVLDRPSGSRAAAGAAAGLLDVGVVDEDRALEIAGILTRSGAAEEAAEAWDLYLELSSRGVDGLSPERRLSRARTLAAVGRRNDAVAELEVLADSRDGAVAAPALRELSRSYQSLGRRDDARAAQERLVREHPGRPEAVDVIFFRGDDAHDRGALRQAADHYDRAVSMAPELNRAGQARMRLGQIRLEQDDPEGAAAVFEGYLEDFPDGRRWDQAAYWAARSRMSLGDTVSARRHLARIRDHNPLSYYAVLTARLLDEPYRPDLPASEPSANPEWLAGGLETVDVLLGAGLKEAAAELVGRFEARAAASDDLDALLALGEGLNERGLTVEGITMGWEARRLGRPWDRRLLRLVYPFPYREMVVREAEEWGVDPFLMAALIRQESAFAHAIVSAAGAVGLMQVMPPTGQQLARAVGPDGFTPAALTSPEVNLHLGSKFLVDMIERFGPDLPLVLAAYNAGPTRARRWRNLPEAADPTRFTERIPFNETRGYVKNVTRNLELYQWLWGEE